MLTLSNKPTSPATFKNHRTCYVRVQSWVRVQEFRHAKLNADDRPFVRTNSSRFDRALIIDQAEVFF